MATAVALVRLVASIALLLGSLGRSGRFSMLRRHEVLAETRLEASAKWLVGRSLLEQCVGGDELRQLVMRIQPARVGQDPGLRITDPDGLSADSLR